MARKFSKKTTAFLFVAAFALGVVLSFLTPKPAHEESPPPPERKSSLFTEELARKPKPAETDKPEPAAAPDTGETGIDSVTGLVMDEGYDVVMANCIRCHSDKLISQNRATRDGWKGIIRWMQKTQNLGELGSNEDIILDYLARNYGPPENQGRRAQLENIEWYELEPDQG